MREQRKNAEEERKAEEALEEAMARLARVRKQKRLLKERGDALFRRGMESLRDAEQQESEAAVNVQSLGALDVIDWGAVLGDSGLPVLDDIGGLVEGISSSGS